MFLSDRDEGMSLHQLWDTAGAYLYGRLEDTLVGCEDLKKSK